VSGRNVRIAIGVAVSLLLLFFAVRNVDWERAWRELQGANYLYVAPMFVISIWVLYIRAQRWRLFLRPMGVPPMSTLVAATNIGFMANMVLPLRIGEVVRPLLVSRRENLPVSGMLASILLERIFDMFTILLLFGVAAMLVPMSPQVRQWGVMLTILACAVGGTVILIRWQERLVLSIVRSICDQIPAKLGEGIFSFAGGFVKALEILDSPAAFLLAFAWSLYLWLIIASIYGLGLIAFNISAPLVVGSLVVTAVVAIAVSVPSAPGYIGAFQIGCVLSLAIFSVEESHAIAYSIVLHVTQSVGVILAGVYSLWTQGMSLSELQNTDAKAA
jgi:glycosyltransferase 2 family protein